MVWRLVIIPLISLLALVPLFTLPASPAAVLGTSRLPVAALKPADAPRPLLSRLLAHQLLRYFTEKYPESHTANPTGAAPPRVDGSTLSHLNRSASPLLTFCAAPRCGACDMLVLTLLHRRKHAGTAHDPHRGIIERWSRPAEHYTRATPLPSASKSIAAAALNGTNAALREAVRELRVALYPQLLSDPHEWQLVWRQALRLVQQPSTRHR